MKRVAVRCTWKMEMMEAEMENAVRFAEESPYPEAEEALEDL